MSHEHDHPSAHEHVPAPAHDASHQSLNEASHMSQSSVPRIDKALFLPISILLAAILVSGTILYTRRPGSNVPPQPTPWPRITIDAKADDHVLGDPNAKVTLVEFSDFQCPFCRAFWGEALQDIKKEYIATGKAKLIFRHFPLSGHPAALIAAEASECAADQGKFWEYHDKVFREQDKIQGDLSQGRKTIVFGLPELKKWAVQIGLNANTFNNCLAAHTHTQRVTEDSNYADSVGIDGTPTLFINGNRLVGAQPFANFKKAIDKEL